MSENLNLVITARTGHFDILHPENESVSVHMSYGDKRINLSFDTDDSCVDWINDPHTWTDTAVQLIDNWNKRMWISTQREDVLKFRTIILSHKLEIDTQKLKDTVEEKRAKMLKLAEQITGLEKDYLDLIQKQLTIASTELQ